MREKGDKGKRGRMDKGSGRKELRSGRILPPVLSLIDSDSFCLFGFTNAHHIPVI